MISSRSILTHEVESLVMAIAARKAAAHPPKKPGRKTMLLAHADAVEKGNPPPPLEFKTVNYTYNKHADVIWKLGSAGDLEALQTMEIKGTNTYAKALRRYRDLFITYLTQKGPK